MSERERYPLSWPQDWKRTAPGHRQYARFKKQKPSTRSADGQEMYGGFKSLSIDDSFSRIEYELERFGVDTSTVIVSTNLKLNLRGMPSGNTGEPSDPGVAVYWFRKGKPQCMAVDAYTRVADNLAAVAATLSAMRAIERHGGNQILERAFLGFAQLPESTGPPWREVLDFGLSTPTKSMVEDRFRELARKRHPDAGGSHDGFTALVKAKEQALREL